MEGREHILPLHRRARSNASADAGSARRVTAMGGGVPYCRMSTQICSTPAVPLLWGALMTSQVDHML